MDFRGPILNALAKAKTSVWTAHSEKVTVNAIAARAANNKPISAEEAAYIYYLLPQYVLYNTPPLLVRAGPATDAPTSFGIAPQQGASAWYWNSTQFSGNGKAPGGSLVTLLVQLQIDATAGISTWALCLGVTFAVGGVLQPQILNTMFVDSSSVQVSDSGVVVTRGWLTFSINVTASGFSIAYNNQVKNNPLVSPSPSSAASLASRSVISFNVTATSARGPTYQQKGGSLTSSGGCQKTYWGVVDGVATGSLTITPNATTSETHTFAKTWSWLDCQQVGLAKLSDAEAFTAAMSGDVPPQVPWMWLAAQSAQIQVAAYFTGKEKLQALQAGKTVQAGTTTVWKSGQPAAFGVAAKAKVLATYAGTTTPSSVQLTLEDGTQYTLNSTSAAPLVPVIPVNCNTYVSSASIVENPQAAGIIEWRTEPLALSYLVNSTNGVPLSIVHASAPSTLARLCVALFGASAVLLVALLFLTGLSFRKSACGSPGDVSTCRDHKIAAGVLAVSVTALIASASALIVLEEADKKKTRKKCLAALSKFIAPAPSGVTKK